MYYIQAASSITHQATFQNPGFFSSIHKIDPEAELVQPAYKEFIDPRSLRRMSKILRMSLACAKDCLIQANIDQPGALIVGTGLGALNDTEKFLKSFISASKDALIPPTSFIQSTHNTIAGQLSLLLKNHNYNMTHTQNSLSFELALQDGLLNLDEGLPNVLVGAADEQIDFLDFLSQKLNFNPLQLTSGSSFFALSKNKDEKSLAQITDVQSIGLFSSFRKCVDAFLEKNRLSPNKIDLILFSTLNAAQIAEIQGIFKENKIINYTDYCGAYMTNAAFACHWAADEISHENYKRIVVCNNLNPENLGLTLIEKCEV